MDSKKTILHRSAMIDRLRETQSRAFLFDRTGEFLNYWFKLPKKGLIPAKSSVRPGDIITLLPDILMLETDTEMLNYRIRLLGTGNVERWGFEATNTNYLNLAAPQQHPALLENFSRTLRTPSGLIMVGEELYTSGRIVRTEMILMPVSTTPQDSTILLGIITADPDTPIEYGQDTLASVFYGISATHDINIGVGVSP